MARALRHAACAWEPSATCFTIWTWKTENWNFLHLRDLILTLILTWSQSQEFVKYRHLSRSHSASSASMSTKTRPGHAEGPMQLNQPNRHLAEADGLHTTRFCDLQSPKKKPSYYNRREDSSIIIILYTTLSSGVVTRFFFKRNQAEKIWKPRGWLHGDEVVMRLLQGMVEGLDGPSKLSGPAWEVSWGKSWFDLRDQFFENFEPWNAPLSTRQQPKFLNLINNGRWRQAKVSGKIKA